MLNFVQTNILEMIEMYGEDKCQNILSSFYCPLNHDVEDFLHTKAISFAKQHLAMTFLVFINQNNQLLLVGYYTLANKSLSLSNNMLIKTIQKKLLKFAQCESDSKQYFVPIPLIAQLGKNDTYAELISGKQLLTIACNRVKQAQKIIGGNMVYIECASNPKLHYFYSTNGFSEFGKRNADKGLPLVQMVKYF